MKRSNSAPCIFDEDMDVKKVKTSSEQLGPNTREYLQLALARVLELQRSVADNTYFADNSSDLGFGDSDNDEDVMRDVLTKVFKDLPGSSPLVPTIIERATRRLPLELNRVRSKSIQLSGYDTCRKVALDFMKSTVRNSRGFDEPGRSLQGDNNRRRDTLSSEYEIRMRMLRGLDLHLAIKQRDYTYNLMRL